MSKFNMKVTPEIEKLTRSVVRMTDWICLYMANTMSSEGLRDLNGKGCPCGTDPDFNVKATKIVDGKEVPCAGKLSYRGYDIKDLTKGFINDRRLGLRK